MQLQYKSVSSFLAGGGVFTRFFAVSLGGGNNKVLYFGDIAHIFKKEVSNPVLCISRITWKSCFLGLSHSEFPSQDCNWDGLGCAINGCLKSACQFSFSMCHEKITLGLLCLCERFGLVFAILLYYVFCGRSLFVI